MTPDESSRISRTRLESAPCHQDLIVDAVVDYVALGHERANVPAGRTSGRLCEEPVDQRGADVLVDIVEDGAHDRAELRRTEGVERLLDLDALCR